jgi:hypothetical protein
MKINLVQTIIISSPRKEYIPMTKSFDGEHYFIPRIGEHIWDNLYKDPDEYMVVDVKYYFDCEAEPSCDVIIEPFEVDTLEVVGTNWIKIARGHGWTINKLYESDLLNNK